MATDDAGARFIASSVACAIAESLTLPTDVAKTRLQVQNNAAKGVQYSGMFDCLKKTAKSEGLTACWKGLQPALLRQVCYGSLSLVLYEPIRKQICGNSPEPTFFQRLLAGGSAGAISISIFNPTEVIKTQIQTASTSKTMRSVVQNVYSQGGILAFWSGIQPNIARTFLVNAAELGTYDEAKTRIVPYTGDNALAHISASGIAGVTSALISTPADVIKTRLMDTAGASTNRPGVIGTFVSTMREEGPGAFYKGFVPIVVRKVLWCTAFFVSYEQIRLIVNST
jgi:hypothetical protein